MPLTSLKQFLRVNTMSIEKEFKISITSPPDRTFLVAEIFFGSEQIAEINRENEKLQIEIFRNRSNDYWMLPCDEFLSTLVEAKNRLIRRLC
jgi:hypothetical protein